MKIGISGASGHLGGSILAELAVRGADHHIVAISRTPDKAGVSAEGRFGDYDHPETLSAAYEGLDRLVIIPSSDVRPGLRDRHFVTAIEAAVGAGVGHIVMISSAATREVGEDDMYAAYWLGEQHLMRTAPHWTILRMNYFAESFAQVAAGSIGAGILAGLGENRVAFVSRDDVGAAAAGILLGEGHAGAIYNATGPVALTGAARAAVISEVMGKPVRFLSLEEDELRSGILQAGIPPQYVDSLVDIERHFLEGSFDVVTGVVERLSGRPPRPLKDVLMKMLG